MTAPHAEQIISGYFARLEAAMTSAAPNVRADVLNELRSHVSEARSEMSAETDADILNLLDRVGDPADIAAEASERPVFEQGSSQQEAVGLPGLAIAALLALLVGPLVTAPFLGVLGGLICLIAGMILARSSRVWSDQDVNVAGLLPILIVAVAILAAAAARGVGHWWVVLVLFLGPASVIPSGIFLGIRTRQRKRPVIG